MSTICSRTAAKWETYQLYRTRIWIKRTIESVDQFWMESEAVRRTLFNWAKRIKGYEMSDNLSASQLELQGLASQYLVSDVAMMALSQKNPSLQIEKDEIEKAISMINGRKQSYKSSIESKGLSVGPLSKKAYIVFLFYKFWLIDHPEFT